MARTRILTMLIMVLLCMPVGAYAQTWPNEPSGFNLVNDWNWNSCPGGGWQPASSPSSCAVIRSDAAAPLSPSSVLSMEYSPASGVGGGDPYILLNNGNGYNEIYLGFWVQLESGFQGEENLSNKLGIFSWGDGSWLWIKYEGQQFGPWFPVIGFQVSGISNVNNCHLPGYGDASPCPSGNFTFTPTQGNSNVSAGPWKRFEFYYKRSSTTTSRDGHVKVWIDGSLVINIIQANTPQVPLNVFYFTPSWAGPGSPGRTHADVIQFDHVHVSAPGGGGADTTPPSQVTGLIATAGNAQVLLNWTAASDNIGVVNYNVERQTACTGSFTVIGTPSATTFTATGLTNGTQYCFRLSANDAAGNTGLVSSTVNATPTAPVGGSTVFGISQGHFTINGLPVRLKCISYYDISNFHTSDIDTLSANGFNCLIGHVDDVLRNDSNSAYNSNGTIKAAKATAIEGAIDYADAAGMVVILNCLYADSENSFNSATYLTTPAARTAAITNCVNEFKDNASVGFSLVNEHTHGSFADTHQEMSAFMVTARAACPSCLIWYSSQESPSTPFYAGSHIWTPVNTGTAVNTTNMQEELAGGINVMAPHDSRASGWETRITATYSNLRTAMNNFGYQSIPILMEEPAREGSGGCGSPSTANCYLGAFTDAIQAGAAGVDFHTQGGFDLSSSTLISQLSALELAVVGGLAAAVDSDTPSVVTFVQSASGTDEASGTSATITFPSATTTGNALLLCVSWKTNQTVTSISGHGTWGQSPAGRLARPVDGYLDCWGAPNITGASSAITVNFSGSVTSIYLRGIEYSGVDTSTMFDSDSATGTATSGSTVSTSSVLDSTTTSGLVFAFATADSGGTAVASPGMTGRFLEGGLGLTDLGYSAMLSNFTPSMDFTFPIGSKAGIVSGLILAATAPPSQTTPRILTLTPNATGATYTFSGSLASVRFQTPAGSTVYTLAQTPGGVITRPWTVNDCEGTDCWACLFARDAAGVENVTPTDYQCRDTTAVIPVADTTPPTSSNVAPVGLVLAAGTTSTTISKTTSENATCRWSTLNEDYDVMPFANQFSQTGGTAQSTSITGLVNATSYTRYSRCVDTAGNKEVASSVHTFSVEAAPPSDTTPPSTVTNFSGTVLSSTQIRWAWTAATDASGISHYKFYECILLDCASTRLIATTPALSLTESGLIPSTSYRRAVTAVDAFGNESASLSNGDTQTTQGPPNPLEDTIPPTRVTGCGATARNPFTVVVTCDHATDLVGVTGYIVEFCEGALCTDWTVLANPSTPTYPHTGRGNNQILNYRVKAQDAAGNVSTLYSPRLVIMTASQGWTIDEATCSCRRKAVR